jgi:hypothetical protein
VSRARPTGTAAISWSWLAAIFLVAAALRLVQLGFEGFWCDEAYTANLIRFPLREMIHDLVTRDDAPPLFYMLEKLGAAITGDSEAGLRLLPALAGLGMVALLLGRARARRDAALTWAASFLAIASYAVFHARQARSYGLLLPLVLVLMLSSRDLLLENRRRAGPWLAAAGALLCITHNVGVLVLMTSFALWPLRPRAGGAPLRAWLLWHLVPFAVCGLYLAASAAQMTTHASVNAWMGVYWERHPLALAPLLSLGMFVPGPAVGGEVQVSFAALTGRLAAWRWLSGGIALVCLAALVWPRGRGAAGSAGAAGAPHASRAVAIEAAFLFAPLIALTLASALWRPTYVLARTDAIAFPAFALLAGRGLARLRGGWRAVCLGLWLAISVAALGPSYGLGPRVRAKGADREVAARVAASGLRPSDFIVHTFLTAPTSDYYLHRLRRPHREVWFPSIAGLNPANTFDTPLDSLRGYEDQARGLRARMERELPAGGAAYLFVLVDPASSPARRTGNAPAEISASDLAYPTSLMLFYLVGVAPQPVVARYRQDWVGGDRAVLRVPRAAWVPLDSLPPVIAAESAGASSAGGGPW